MTKMLLHRVIVKVRPLPGHPKYYDLQFGCLSIWLYAESSDDAWQRASNILAELPFEQVGAEARVDIGPKESPSFDAGAPGRAAEIGLALSLAACPTGVDETEFENMPLA